MKKIRDMIMISKDMVRAISAMKSLKRDLKGDLYCTLVIAGEDKQGMMKTIKVFTTKRV